jgi:hypothetical protein
MWGRRSGACRGGGRARLNGRAASPLARCDQRRRIVRRPLLAYHFGFSGELRTRFTTDRDIRKVRAMSAALTPALSDARMRFAVPSGIFSIPLILLLVAAGFHYAWIFTA